MSGSAWDGSTWRDGTPYVWDGSSWRRVIDGYTWNGTAWERWHQDAVPKVLEESVTPGEVLSHVNIDGSNSIQDIAAVSESHEQAEESREVSKPALDESLTPAEAVAKLDTEASAVADAASVTETHAVSEESRDTSKPAIDESVTPADAVVITLETEAETVADAASVSEEHSVAQEDRDVAKPALSESVTPSESVGRVDLTAPTGLQLSWSTVICQATLSWTDNSTGEDGYRIYRDGVLIDTIAANSETYTDMGAAAGTQYTWTVEAYHGSDTASADLTDTTGTCEGPS